jgi:hypothetical protein
MPELKLSYTNLQTCIVLAVPDLEVELVNIVLRESERIPQHDHVLQCERTLGRDVLELRHRGREGQSG